MSAHAPEVDAVHVKPARAALASDVIGVQPKIDFDVRTLKDICIYIAANAASSIAVSGPRAAAAAFRATAKTSVIYGVGVKSALALGVDTSPAIALATAVAAACSPAGATLAMAQPAASKALLFGKSLPVGVFFAAEYAAFVAAKGRVVASGALPETVAETPLGRFGLGAASITALCAVWRPARALCAPSLAAATGISVAASASQMMTATRSKAVWYGTFEALKTVAHGPHRDAAPAAPAIAIAAPAAPAIAAEAEKFAKEKERAPARLKRSSTGGATARGRRLPTRKARAGDVALTRGQGPRTCRSRVLHTPLKVLTRMVV